ncbi:MAG: vanadium-dependent haloperoxidase [Opitutaceae bacterium]
MKSPFVSSPVLRRLITGLGVILTLTFTVRADVITDWNATLEATMRNPTPNPAVQARAAAIMHTAVFDAVNGITKKYTPLYFDESAPGGARAEAAAAQAAYTTLVALFPAKQSLFDAQLTVSLAQIPGSEGNSQSIARGRAWGQSVAEAILAWRANDGFSRVLTYTDSGAPGYWRHFPNASGPAAALSMTVTTPFALSNPAAFDPGPPYGFSNRLTAMSTAAYTTDLNEVKARGGAVSTARTPAETDLALFINISDVTDINALVRRLISPKAKLVDNARTFALLNIAGMDATIVCFQSKYQYGLWRPYQAIPFANEDGNNSTAADPTWVPLRPTPPHPEYLSGHALVISSMLAVAATTFGDQTPFVLTTSNPGAPAIAPEFTSFSELSAAITEARINIGFHFRTACELGQATAGAIVTEILSTTLVPRHGGGKAD